MTPYDSLRLLSNGWEVGCEHRILVASSGLHYFMFKLQDHSSLSYHEIIQNDLQNQPLQFPCEQWLLASVTLRIYREFDYDRIRPRNQTLENNSVVAKLGAQYTKEQLLSMAKLDSRVFTAPKTNPKSCMDTIQIPIRRLHPTDASLLKSPIGAHFALKFGFIAKTRC